MSPYADAKCNLVGKMHLTSVLVLILLRCSVVFTNTHFLFANVSGNRNYNAVVATCVSDDFNHAIAWITPFDLKSSPQQKIPTIIQEVKFDWFGARWAKEQSYKGRFGPISDYSWEAFKIYNTQGAKVGTNYQIQKIVDPLNIINQFEVNLSFLGKSNAQIYICDNEYLERGKCLTIILGGWDGFGSIIRRCNAEKAPKKSTDPACDNLLERVDHSAIFSENIWSQISIQYFNKVLVVFVNGKQILFYKVDDDEAFKDYSTMFVHSYTENAKWKYHQYYYYESRLPVTSYTSTNIDSEWFQVHSNKLCLSVLANFTNSISLEILEFNQLDSVALLIFARNETLMWQYLQISSVTQIGLFYKLRINFDAREYVSVRNIFVHSCDLPHLHTSTIQYTGKDVRNVKCTLLNSNTKLLQIENNNTERDCTLNNDCNICLSLYNVSECVHKLICDEKGCFCSMGYSGKFCEKQCDTGSYGFNCVSKCGECKEVNDCLASTGVCINGCKDNYISDTCHQQNYPVLRNVSLIPSTCVNSCNIILYDKKIDYDSLLAPHYYYTVWYQQGQFLKETELMSIAKKNIFIDDLINNNNYEFEVILCIEYNRDNCYKDNLTKFTLLTTCYDIQKSDIKIWSESRATNVEINNNGIPMRCALSQYYTELFDEQNNFVSSGYLDSYKFVIYNLQVFSTYFFHVIRSSSRQMLHNITFVTDETIPYAVQNLKKLNTSISNKLIIDWLEPTPKTGKITKYLVEWKWMGKRGCTLDTSSNAESKNVTTLSTELPDLKPYSIYNISIYAYTKKGRGSISQIRAETSRENSSFPNNIAYDTRLTQREAIISVNVSCTDWDGPFFVVIQVTCTSNWCMGMQTNTTTKQEMPNITAVVKSLLAYTNYTIAIYLSRRQSLNNIQPIETRHVMTLPSVPNQIPFVDVFSLSSNSLSLRWAIPYPPTGKLKFFKIKYFYMNWRNSKVQKSLIIYLDNTKCNIWQDMYCITLNTLYADYNYHISITSENENVNGESIANVITKELNVGSPNPPLNVQAIWDESRMLTVQWQHPNRTNGIFQGFNLTLNKDRREINMVPQLIYQFNSTFQCTPSNHYADFSMQTLNNERASRPVTQQFHCPVFKPSFQSNPLLVMVTNETLTVKIPQIEDSEIISNLYIILIINHPEKEGDCQDITGKTFDSYITIKKSQVCFILDQYNQSQYNAIQNTKMNVNFKQLPKFNFEANLYDVGILLANEYMAKQSYNWYQLESGTNGTINNSNGQSSSRVFNYWWLLLIFLPVAIFASIGILWRVQPWWLSKLLFSPAPVHMNDDNKQPDLIPLASGEEMRLLGNALPASTQQAIIAPIARPSVSVKPNTRNLPVANFEEYVKEAIQNGELQKQHEKFERGMLKSADCGKLPENYPKNRYKNLIAYDSTRVKLQCINGKPSTDYINANYIKSPICKKAYIATQGPIDTTIYDFWFMIFTEGVQYIIMLANLVEDGKKKVSAYWPDFKKMNKTLVLDDIEVCAIGLKTNYSYEIRTFTLKYNNSVTEVTQLHFTSWPDHGVPLYPESLKPFIKEILDIPHDSEHPILVHCSAGVGRTGTILLIDICLRQAQLTQHMDPFKELGLLRNQRPNLVDNIEQYKLVHLVLLDYFSPLQTTFKCEEFNVYYSGLTNAVLTNLLQYIDESIWQESAIIPEPRYILKVDPEKNRDQEIIPALYGVLYLRPQATNDSTYINAVTVDGFNAPKRFIATQHPLENTIDDFWRLVDEQDVKLVVSLQPTYDVKFWENGGDFATPHGSLIEHIQTAECPEISTHTIFLTVNGMQKNEIKLIELSGWDIGQDAPSNLANLLALWREVNNLKLADSRIIVMCRNGATATGLYIAMSNLLDRIQAEQVVNICKCVRVIRRSRKQFVTTVEQLKLLHRAAALLLSEFEIYSNFTPIVQSTTMGLH